MVFKPNSSVIELTPQNYDLKNKKIKHPKLSNKKGMVAYVASWCPHCVRVAPVYEQVADTLGTSFPLFYLDCVKYADFARNKLQISSFPTIMYIDRDSRPYKPYEADRSEIAMMEDICKEAHVCSRRS